MRRWYGVALAIVLALVGVAIGVGAYHAGVSHGLEAAGSGGEMVRYWGPGPGWGFFPFGFLFFPLFLIGIFVLLRFAFWGRRWGDHPHPHPMGPGGWGGREAFEDWHRREHERSGANEGPDGPSTST